MRKLDPKELELFFHQLGEPGAEPKNFQGQEPAFRKAMLEVNFPNIICSIWAEQAIQSGPPSAIVSCYLSGFQAGRAFESAHQEREELNRSMGIKPGKRKPAALSDQHGAKAAEAGKS